MGYRIKFSLESKRQTEHWAMQIECRQFLAEGDDFARPLNARENALQGRLHLDDDLLCAKRHHHRDVAGELNAVPEALLSVDEDHLSFKRSIAKPQWLIEVARLGSKVSCFPAPLVFLPAFLEIPNLQKCQTAVPACFRRFGIDFDGFVVSSDRFCSAS